MIRYTSSQTLSKIFTADDLLYTDFENCIFDECDFRAAHFTGVAFIDCTFRNCNFESAKINYVALRGAHFANCDFSGVNFAMVDPMLFDISFTNCILDYTKFYTLKLPRTVFTGCSIVASDFMASDLTEAVFDACNLHKTVFIDTIANKTDFFTSFNYEIDPERNKLKKAIFSKEGLRGLLTRHGLVVK